MVVTKVMYKNQQQQQQQQQLKNKNKCHKFVETAQIQTLQQRPKDYYYTLTKCYTTTATATAATTTTTTNYATTTIRLQPHNNNFYTYFYKKCKNLCCLKINIIKPQHYCSSGVGGRETFRGSSGLYLWFVLLLLMLILCGNTVISQQQIINNNNNNNNNNKIVGNILLQFSTIPPPPLPPSPSPSPLTTSYNNKYYNNKNVNDDHDDDGINDGGGINVKEKQVLIDDVALKLKQGQHKQQQQIFKTNTITKTSSSSSTSSSFSSSSTVSNNAPALGISNTNSNNTYNNNKSLINDGENIKANINSSSSTSTSTSSLILNNLLNNNRKNKTDSSEESVEILNESEDEFEHSSAILSTTSRPVRSSIAPVFTSIQERERRLMNVLAARRSALQRPGFRNRIATTGRTATAVETTSKSPTDPRSICIRNCTKNFTRRTTASCMRQCANFSRVASAANSAGGSSSTTLVVKTSSKSGTGTAQAGEKDTNEILFTDESSHGLLVIAKEQNDTLNHIPDENKGGTVAKLRGRRKQQTPISTVTLATTSVEDDEIQPYLYFGQKLPPLKPNALTITSVSDEHPKILEVSVADMQPSSTTPVTLTTTSTLSAVERSRARFKYNMRNGVSFNRRYTTINRSTTPEVPAELRTTTLRIVAEVVKEPEIVEKLAQPKPSISFMDKVRDTATPMPFMEALREEMPKTSSTPLIITVLSDEEIMATTHRVENVTAQPTVNTSTATSTTESTTSSSTTTTTTTTTRKPITTTTTTTRKPITTTTTTTTPTTTTTSTTTTTTTSTKPTTTTISSTTSTTTSTSPFIKASTNTFTTPISSTSTSTSTPAPIASTTAITTITTKKNIISDEDTELLRQLGPSLTQPVNTDDKTNLIIFVNRTTDLNRPHVHSATKKYPPSLTGYGSHSVTTDSSATIIHTTILTSIRSTVNTINSEMTTTPKPLSTTQKLTTSSTAVPVITGEISSTVVTDDQEISLEMERMNIVTMVLAAIGIVPLLAIILYLVRNYLLKRPLKDDEDFDVCITDQQPISPVKKLDNKYQAEDMKPDEVDHHKKPPQRQHSLHSKLVTAPLARDNNHNLALTQQRYDDKSSVTSDQEIDRTNIRLKSLLGEGNFGQVWKAEADDLSGHFGATRIVAVKTIKACSTQLSLKDEANIMRKLGSHQNVVTLLGACVDSEPHMLIMEYAMRGRLLSLLRAARNATNILPASVPGGRSLTPLSPRTLAGFCLDIARGMEYIAEKRIVHRDLAARNVLLDHNGVCKICDFGMSIDLDAERKRKELEKSCANEIMRSNFNKFKFDFGGKFIINHWTPGTPKDCSEKKAHHTHDTIGKRPALPIRWMAPEALQYNIFSTETDIWAFGIVLWEIATLGSTPYSQITGREVIRRVPQGLRPDLPKEGRHEFYNLMSRCWHKDPHMRPSFGQCRLEITRSLHKWVDDDSAASDYMDVSGFSEDLEQGMVYFNHRISEFECEI